MEVIYIPNNKVAANSLILFAYENKIAENFAQIKDATELDDVETVFAKQENLKAVFALPIPSVLEETFSHNWDGDSLAQVAVDTVKDLAGNLTGDKSMLGSIGGAAKAKMGGVVFGAVMSVVQPLLKNAPGALAASGAGVPNPLKRNVYQSSSPRSLSFSWEFVPNNIEEAKDILYGCNYLKALTAPERKMQVFLQPPCVFKLGFIVNGTDLANLGFVFNRMAITEVKVQYGQSESNFFQNGAPKKIELSISMNENELVFRHNFSTDNKDELTKDNFKYQKSNYFKQVQKKDGKFGGIL